MKFSFASKGAVRWPVSLLLEGQKRFGITLEERFLVPFAAFVLLVSTGLVVVFFTPSLSKQAVQIVDVEVSKLKDVVTTKSLEAQVSYEKISPKTESKNKRKNTMAITSVVFDFLEKYLPLSEVTLDEAAQDVYSYQYTSLGFGLKDLEVFKGKRSESEKKLYTLLPKRIKKRAQKYIRPVLILCQKHQVDPFWVLSVMWTESHFAPRAVSHVGARGLMQVMPGTRKFVYRNIKKKGQSLVVEQKNFDLEDYFEMEISPKQKELFLNKLVNMEIGIVYLKSLLKQFNYNHRYATVAYNMGPGWTRKRLRRRLPVGVKNKYLDKVTNAYAALTQKM